MAATQAQFDAKSCNAFRQNAFLFHDVVSRNWKCQSHDHRGNFKLSLQAEKMLDPAGFNLLFSSTKSQPGSSLESWQELLFELDEATQTTDPEVLTPPAGTLRPADIMHLPAARPKNALKSLFKLRSLDTGTMDVEMVDARLAAPGKCM